MSKKPDFIGWATRSNMLCNDGRTIMENAFACNDGDQVPLVWHHQYNDPGNILGHGILKNVPGGVKVFGYFNDSENGQHVKQLVQNGDLQRLSIFANQLVHAAGTRNVTSGRIQEVSLVPTGANPGATITDVIQHGSEAIFLNEDEGVVTMDDSQIVFGEVIEHAGDPKDDEDDSKDNNKSKDEKTLKDVYESMNEEQKNLVNYVAGSILEEAAKGKLEDDDDDDNDEGGKEKMKHNAFDRGTTPNDSMLIHAADQAQILASAKQNGSFKRALADYMSANSLQHDGDDPTPDPEPFTPKPASGFPQSGTGNVSYLFPEYKDVRPGAPELITYDQGWVNDVINKVHKSPISRIRTSFVDIRDIEDLRARGYKKGYEKKITGNFELVRRTTDPQTVYVKSQLHRDDIVDITDFDYVQYLYNIDRINLNEEIAKAIMIGDGRADGDDKIYPDKIRPIWLDDELYTIHRDIDLSTATSVIQGTNTGDNFGENFIYAESMVNACLYAREDYKGTGMPDMYISPHVVNIMLLARDRNGRRIYSNVNELAAALNVRSIITVEQFANKTRTTTDSKTKKLLCLITNLADYNVGATKGGEITHFTDFDIDFNQQKSLMETRISGALIRIKSAIAIEQDVTANG